MKSPNEQTTNKGFSTSVIYHNPRSEKQCANVEAFREIEKRFPWMEFYQPNEEKAPWLYQCVVRYEGKSSSIKIDFWPHKGRAMREGCKPVEGYESIRAMISEAIDDSSYDFEVIEE